MAVTIPASPTGSMTVADQSLIYTLLTGTSPLPAGFRIWVKVYENGTTAADLISTLYLTPNTNDTAFFNLAEVVKGRVSVDDRRYGLTDVIHEPISTGVYMTRSDNNVKLYTVSVGEFDGSTEGSQDASATVYLIDGHFQISQGYDPGFADYYGTANTVKYWLTGVLHHEFDDHNKPNERRATSHSVKPSEWVPLLFRNTSRKYRRGFWFTDSQSNVGALYDHASIDDVRNSKRKRAPRE